MNIEPSLLPYSAPGCVEALGAARPASLHEELLTQPLLAELAPVTRSVTDHIFSNIKMNPAHGSLYISHVTASLSLKLKFNT